MDIVKHLLVAVHLLCMATVVGSWIAHFRGPTVTKAQLIAAAGSLVSGLLLVGMAEMAATADNPVNHAKIGVKAIIALVVLVAAIIGVRKASASSSGETSVGISHAVGGMALINVLIATLWQ